MTIEEHVAGTVDIRPEVNILGMLKNLNYKPWFALGEFVDNAVGAFLRARGSTLLDDDQHRVRVSIQIKHSERSVTIFDDSTGIALEDFPRAFRAAEVPPDRTGLSEFGMGMKSAATWFAGRWSVETSVLGEPVARAVTFDIATILADQVQELDVIERPASAGAHYTMVRLDDVHHFLGGRVTEKIEKHLTSIYRRFIREGTLILRLNDRPLEFNEVVALEASPAWAPVEPRQTWKRAFEIDFGSGLSASGFAGVRAEGNTVEAGFALFRRGRLIEGSHEETYKPRAIFKGGNSYEWQRLYGEVELEGFDVSHTKDGFIWGAVTEDEFIERLKEELEDPELNLVKQARDHRARATSAKQRNAIARVVEDGVSRLPKVVEAVEAEAAADRGSRAAIQDRHTAPEEDDSRVDAEIVVQEVLRETRIATDIAGARWEIELAAVVDTEASDWLEYKRDTAWRGAEAPTRLRVTVNFGHPFLVQHRGRTTESLDVLLKFASAIAIAASTQDAIGREVPIQRLIEVALRSMSRTGLQEEIE